MPLGISRRSFQRKLQNMSEKNVLKCQELGLNTCWVAMTHGKSKAEIRRGQNGLKKVWKQ